MPNVTSSLPAMSTGQWSVLPYPILFCETSKPHCTTEPVVNAESPLFSQLSYLSRILLMPVCTSFPSPHPTPVPPYYAPTWAHCAACEKIEEGRSPCALSAQGTTSTPPILTPPGTAMFAQLVPVSWTSRHISATPIPYLSELCFSHAWITKIFPSSDSRLLPCHIDIRGKLIPVEDDFNCRHHSRLSQASFIFIYPLENLKIHFI